MDRLNCNIQVDLFDQTQAPAPKPVTKEEFPTLRKGRDWLTVHGWQPRHGGGYEKAGGYAVLKDLDGVRVYVEMR